MKHAETDREIYSVLEQEMPRRPLSPRAKARFEETYRILGAQEKAPRKSHRRVWITTASALAACFLMIFGVNAAFPAFAEGLPVVGQMFQSLNGNSHAASLKMGKSVLGVNVADSLTKPIDVSQTSGDYTLTVQNAFCDGETMTIALDMTGPAEVLEQIEYTVVDSILLSVNGEKADFLSGSGESNRNDLFFSPNGKGKLAGAFVCRLPAPAENGEVLNVGLAMNGFSGKDRKASDYADNPIFMDGADFDISFTVEADTTHNRDFECPVEDNGVKLLAVHATPVRTQLKVTLPVELANRTDAPITEWEPALYLPEGVRVTHNWRQTFPEGYDYEMKEEQTVDMTFDGLPEGTETAVLRIYEDTCQKTPDSPRAVYCEFTVDLKNGSAAVTQTYLEDGPLALDSPFDYEYLFTERSEVTMVNGFSLNGVFFDNKSSQFQLTIQQEPAPYRELKVKIENAAGETVAEMISSDSPIANSSLYSYYLDPASEFWEIFHSNPENNWGDNYTYNIVGVSEYHPACGEVLTVKVTDNQSGEELLTDTVGMTEKM